MPDSKVGAEGKRSGRLQNYLSHLLLVLSIGAAILAGLFIIPLEPLMPVPGLDPAWMQALNEAVARHLVFGRAVIFTYGPFASVYTCLYHPATDTLMLGGRVLIAFGFVVGYLMLCWRRRVYLLLVLPLFTANVWVAYLSFDCFSSGHIQSHGACRSRGKSTIEFSCRSRSGRADLRCLASAVGQG